MARNPNPSTLTHRMPIGLVAIIALVCAQAVLATSGQAAPRSPIEQAQATGEPVPIPELTTTTTAVVANPDGTYTAQIAAGPVREPDAGSPSGWAPVDLTLQQADGQIQPAVADAGVSFSDGGTQAAATLSHGTEELA